MTRSLPTTDKMIRRCRPLLGTFVEIAVSDGALIDVGFAAIVQAQRLLNAHDPTSELSAINRTAHIRPVFVHSWTETVLRRALFWASASEAAFDPTVGGLMHMRGLLPTDTSVPRPDPAAGWRDVHIANGAVELGRPLRLDLGGIAKGFSIDCAVDAMRDAGADRGLVNAGGDMRAFGPRPWPITIVAPASRRPLANVALCDSALATSAGHAGPHLLDMRHLAGASGTTLSASVEARSAMDADALTKIMLSGCPNALCCLDLAEASALLISDDGRISTLDPKELAA